MNFFLYETVNEGNTAGSKARKDIATILKANRFWVGISIKECWGETRLIKRLEAVCSLLCDWLKVVFSVKCGDKLLIQYPIAMYPRVSKLVLPFLSSIKKRGVEISYLVHDLDGLRGFDRDIETSFLSFADQMIVHNAVMLEYVHRRFPSAHLINLGVFDYLLDSTTLSIPRHQLSDGIAVAGNLSLEKAGYLYKLSPDLCKVSFNLYGVNFQGHGLEKWYRGVVSPDELPYIIKGAFGLVWDGDSTETCSGKYGEYLRVNNPHKLSLYLASHMPVLIWDEAAEAEFIRSNGLGFPVRSINEAVDIASGIDELQYSILVKNVESFASKLNSGYFTNTAVSNL